MIKQPKLVLNGVEVDFDTGLLRSRDGADIPLRPQSLAVLRHLVANANRVVGKDELLDAVWPGIAVTDNSLSQCISEIRKAIGDESQSLLKTVARRGYRLVPDNAAAPALPVDSAAEPHVLPHAAPPSRSRIARNFGIALAAVILAAVFWWPRQDAGVPASLSIAVLPFANLSEAKEQAYLANGFTDDLTAELARVPSLFVISRNAAAAFRDSRLAPARIASELGVRYLLEGSVQRQGDDMRINAHLVDATTAEQIWAKGFDGKFADLFTLQDAVVGQIVAALQLKLVPGKANLAVSGDTKNPEAYEAFRRGVEAQRRGTPPDTVEALGYLRQALALDPDFGGAAAEMAWLYWDTDETRRKALGLSWEEVDNGIHDSLALASDNPPPGYYQLHSELLVREHRSDEAIALLRKAMALDPSDSWTYEGLSQALIFNGKPVEGRAFLDMALRVDPGWSEWRYYQAGLAAFGDGRYEEAVAALGEIDPASSNPWPKFYGLHVKVAALAHLGRTAEASEALDRLSAVFQERQEGQPNLLTAQRYFIYKRPEDMARLLGGLRKAGVPDLPVGLAAANAQRLNGSEIVALVFGHELKGRRRLPETASYHATIAADGAITKTIGGTVFTGHAWVQGDHLCTAYPRVLASCGALFRNPDGTPEAMNEYTMLFPLNSRYEFSVAK